ncbi:hypothetical protein GIB67_006764, partial [Kingdonia uniflora]
MATLQFKDDCDSMKVGLREFDSSWTWQANELRAIGWSRDVEMEKRFSSPSVICHSFVLDADVELIECGKSFQFYTGKARVPHLDVVSPMVRKKGGQGWKTFAELIEGQSSRFSVRQMFRAVGFYLISQQAIKASLDSFSSMTGLEVNFEKSAVYFSSVNETVKLEIIEELGVNEAELPFKYLGVSLISTRLSSKHCNPLIEKMSSKVLAGAIDSFLMLADFSSLNLFSLVPMLISVVCLFYQSWLLTRSTQSVLGFSGIWHGHKSGKKSAPISWRAVCYPREGGLGINDLETWNQAAVLKLTWKIVSKQDSLWTVWVEKYLIKGRSFWLLPIPNQSSWAWRQILNSRVTAKMYVKYVIVDGQRHSLLVVSNYSWNILQHLYHNISAIVDDLPPIAVDPMRDNIFGTASTRGDFNIAEPMETIRIKKGKIHWANICWSKFNIPRQGFTTWILLK